MKLFKNNQSGRSMVEMLGVLAIIGVLSVGGIAGYSKAMYKHKINQTIDIVSRALMNVTELTSKPNNSDFQSTDAVKAGVFDGLSCDEEGYCTLPTGYTIDAAYSTIRINLIGNSKSDRIKFCIDVLSHHWESMLPEGIKYISPLTYSGGFTPVYSTADHNMGGYNLSTKLSYGLSDIQDACTKSCDNDIYCYIYIKL